MDRERDKKKTQKPKVKDFAMSEFIPKPKKVQLMKVENEDDLPLLERIVR